MTQQLTDCRFKIVASAMTNRGAWAKTVYTLPAAADEAWARRAFYGQPMQGPAAPHRDLQLDLIKTGYAGKQYTRETLATRRA